MTVKVTEMLFVTVALFVTLAVLDTTRGRDEFVGSLWFYRTYSDLIAVPDDIPDGALKVHLDNNDIVQLEDYAFSNLALCTEITLYWNSINYIQNDAFNGLVSLEILYIGNNNLTYISSNLFVNLNKCRELDLSWNRIEFINRNSFVGLSNLEVLYLDGNEVSFLQWGNLPYVA